MWKSGIGIALAVNSINRRATNSLFVPKTWFAGTCSPADSATVHNAINKDSHRN
jgi:hypothetical protein